MSDYLPKFKPGQAVTYTAGEDLVGGDLVELTAPRTVKKTTAASVKVVGVVAHDVKNGDKVAVYAGGVQRIKASAAIAAGAQVDSAAGGKTVAGTTSPIGLALTAATAADQLVEVLMNR